MLEDAGLARIALRELHLDENMPVDLTEWKEMLTRINGCEKKVRIALVGKYVQLHDSYLSVVEALKHGGWENNVDVDIDWVDSESLTADTVDSVLRFCPERGQRYHHSGRIRRPRHRGHGQCLPVCA